MARSIFSQSNNSKYRHTDTVRLNALQYFEVEMHLTSQSGICYVPTQHLAKKCEQAILKHVRRDGKEIAFCQQNFGLVNDF